eukprot:542041-Karenia_brevis.AAC.1
MIRRVIITRGASQLGPHASKMLLEGQTDLLPRYDAPSDHYAGAHSGVPLQHAGGCSKCYGARGGHASQAQGGNRN